MTQKFQPHLQCIQSVTGKNLTDAQTDGKGIVKTCTMMKKGKEFKKNIGSNSVHHLVQRLLVPSVRQQVAKSHRSWWGPSRTVQSRRSTSTGPLFWRFTIPMVPEG